MDYHDMSDDYKQRKYTVAITLQDGEYSGNIYHEYYSTGYGLYPHVIESLYDLFDTEFDDFDLEENRFDTLAVHNNCNLRLDVNMREIHFSLKNSNGNILNKIIDTNKLSSYVVGVNIVKEEGCGKKKETRKCIGCENFNPIEDTAKGFCPIKNKDVWQSTVICAFDYVKRKQ